ncbi:MAG: basic amino acid/polyamine antiporter, family [Thermoplasmata archaeon]|nr:basic amino acid/polyamine antiporter, family [Thermoplasmata archaeon]
MTEAAAPKRTLGLTTATTIIVGSMIGSGILLLPADMLAKLPSPPLVMAVFVVAAILTAVGALTVAELSGMFPKAGGQYVYLREAFGPFPAYLFGWTTFWVVQTGTIAAVAAAFAKILARFVPLPGAATPLAIGNWHTGLTLPPYGQAFVAIALILLLTFVNYLGVRFGGLISNASTLAKAAGLLAVVAIVLVFAHAPPGAFGPATAVHQPGDSHAGAAFTGMEVLAGFSTALMLILFAYDGWYSATYVAAEMRNPRRDVPLSLILGPLATTAIYLAVAGACLYAVSLTDALHLGGNEYLAGRAVKDAIGEGGAVFVSVLALVSIFGTTNAYVLTAPRIAYAQAKDGLFLRSMGRLDPKRGTPAYGSLLCGLWACLLVMTGLYDQLVASVVFAVFLFHVLTAAAHLKLRRTRPDLERPFRTPGGPTIPLLFLLTSLFVVVATLAFPDYRIQALLELAIILVGVPAYFLARRRAGRAAATPAHDAQVGPH